MPELTYGSTLDDPESNPSTPRKIRELRHRYSLPANRRLDVSAGNVHWVSVDELHAMYTARWIGIKFALLLLYLAVFAAFFTHHKGWNWVDAAYFAVVTLTTVGYGDLHPETAAEKLVCVFLTFVAISFIAMALGSLLDDFVLKASSRHRCVTVRRVAGEICVMLCGIVVAGAVPYRYLEGQTWVDSVYWASITVATVGYGDSCPKTRHGRLFATFYLLVGAALTARAVGQLASLPTQWRQRCLERCVERQFGSTLSLPEYHAILDEVKNLGVRPACPTAVAEAEFVLAMLVSLGRISRADVRECRLPFRRLDSDRDGLLEENDVNDVPIRFFSTPLGGTCATEPNSL